MGQGGIEVIEKNSLKAIVVGIHTNFKNFSIINFIVLISREESITWSQELLRKVLSADSKL